MCAPGDSRNTRGRPQPHNRRTCRSVLLWIGAPSWWLCSGQKLEAAARIHRKPGQLLSLRRPDNQVCSARRLLVPREQVLGEHRRSRGALPAPSCTRKEPIDAPADSRSLRDRPRPEPCLRENSRSEATDVIDVYDQSTVITHRCLPDLMALHCPVGAIQNMIDVEVWLAHWKCCSAIHNS